MLQLVGMSRATHWRSKEEMNLRMYQAKPCNFNLSKKGQLRSCSRVIIKLISALQLL